MDSPVIVATPNMTVRIEMTMATIGRRMKKFDMAYFPLFFSVVSASAFFSGAFSAGFAPG
jgi:hypothetical protein